MNARHCQVEDELLDALERGFVSTELEEHLAACPGCSELRQVAGALLDDRAQAIMAAPIPSAATMWWRMQVRHRQEAEATARRSLLAGQAVTLAVVIALLISFFGTDIALEARQMITAIRLSTPILMALGTWIIAAPIAGWVALRQK